MFFGHSFDITSISGEIIDSFILYKNFGGSHKMFGVYLQQQEYMRLVGALQTGNWDGHSKLKAFNIYTFGLSYGPAPYYGEIPYTGRMAISGFKQGDKDSFNGNIIKF